MTRSSAPGAAGPADPGHGPADLVDAVQPHGLLLVVQAPLLRIVQASTSAASLLRRPLDSLLLASVHDLGGDLGPRLSALPETGPLQPLQCTLGEGPTARRFAGSVQHLAGGALVVELEPLPALAGIADVADLPRSELLARLAEAVQRFGEAASVAALAAAAARAVRALTGYDHVVIAGFDPDGRGHVLAESLDAQQRQAMPGDGPRDPAPSAAAREALLRQRMHLLVDVHALPSPLLPALPPGAALGGLACSRLRSPSALQAQQLREGGVVAALTVALVCEDRLWGQIRCLHGRPRDLGHGLRAGIELLAEAFGTRLLALQNHARALALAEVHRLMQRLLEATAADGDWPAALLRHPHLLLQPLAASGAMLCHEGQTLACGDVPRGAARQALLTWLAAHPAGAGPVHDAALDPTHPARRAGVCGVLAVRLSSTRPEALFWLRPEHARGGAALPWTDDEVALAASFGAALSDLMLQVDAVRLLIAESQLARLRAAVAGAPHAAIVVDAAHRACHANAAFDRLRGSPEPTLPAPGDLCTLFTEPERAQRVIAQVRAERRPWQGELALRRADGSVLPVTLRAEPVPAGDHGLLGVIFTFEDRSATQRADAARTGLGAALARTRDGMPAADGQALLAALLANAGLAEMDITEGGAPAAVPARLAALATSTTRATALLARIDQAAPRDAP